MTMRMTVALCGVFLALVGCNPGSSAAALVRLEAEMAGARCAHGGIAVLTGLDTNSNQVLDDEEVNATQTKYVCNGAPGGAGAEGPAGATGSAGADGRNALSVVTAEPAGANCTYGGVRIDVGIDLDGDGQLGTSEITGTRYICDRASVDSVYFGDLIIRDASDVALLAGIEILAGSLTIEVSPTATLSFPSLKVVSGAISLGGQDGGYYPAVNAAPMLTTLDFPELVRAGSIYFSNHPSVTSISMPKLERTEQFVAWGNLALTALALPRLVKTDLLRVTSNDSLTSFSAPSLRETIDLNVSYNTALSTLTIGALRAAQWFSIQHNSGLSHCQVYRVVAALDAEPRYGVSIWGNDETPTCTTTDFCRARTITGISGSLRQCVLPRTFAAAQTECASFGAGAALVWFESAAEWTAFKAAWTDRTMSWSAWIGYTDAAVEGTWVAVSGFTGFDPTTRTDFWEQGEPNGGPAENNAQIYLNGNVNDADDSYLLPFICRVP